MKKVLLILIVCFSPLLFPDDPLPRIDSFAFEDFSWVKRTLVKEPSYKSEKVRYAIWVLGEGKKSVMTIAWDESEGTGKGYDTLYVDANFNGDLTEPTERLFYANPAPKGKKPPQGKAYERYEIKGVKEADGDRIFDFIFDSRYNHDEIEYNSEYTVKGKGFSYTVGNLPWSMKLKWAHSLEKAPAYRLGGVAFPIPSFTTGNRRNRKRLSFLPGEELGTWEAGTAMKFDILVVHPGESKDVHLRFRGGKFPGEGKSIQGLRWGRGGYPVCILRVLEQDGKTAEEIPLNPGCP